MLVRVLLVLVSLSAVAVAAPVPKSLKKVPDQFDTARFKLRYDKVPFSRALEHFAEETGLEWVGDRPELGTVTLQSLQGKEYTAAEFVDLLNERLELDNYILIRHAKTFYIHPARQPIDVEKLDTLSVEDIIPPRVAKQPAKRAANPWGGGTWVNGQWVPADGSEAVNPQSSPPPPPPKRGKTELATVVIPLTTVSYDDIRPQVVKSLSKFGQGVESCEGGRAMRVTDRVDNLRFLHAVVNESVKSNCGIR